MPTFPRTLAPLETDPPRSNAAPLQSPALNSKRQVRETLAAGFTWSEMWPPLDIDDPEVRGLLAEIDAWFRAGTVLDVRPFHWRNSTGTIAAGTAGAIAGAGQAGQSIDVDGFPGSGTFRKGDYVSTAGLGYAQWILADTAASGGGAATLTLDPPVFVGSEPADDAVVTLNGLLQARIIQWTTPRGIATEGTRHRGLSVTFEEAR